MSTTLFNDVERVWSGSEVDIDIDINKNFGEFILERLTDADPERVLQVSVRKSVRMN